MNSERLDVYKRIIKGLGIGFGLKEISMIWLGHITKAKHSFFIKSSKIGREKFYIRTNTSDLQIVRSFLLDNGEYDWINQQPFYEYIKNARTFVDAGANIGVVSRLLMKLNPHLKGVAIEPDLSNYSILKKNLQAYNVKCINCGLWNKDTRLDIVKRNDGSEVSFVVPDNNYLFG